MQRIMRKQMTLHMKAEHSWMQSLQPVNAVNLLYGHCTQVEN